MSLKPLDLEQIQGTCQIVLAYLDDPENSTPNNMVEGIAGGKSLLRGVLSGNLVICQKAPDVPEGMKARIERTPKVLGPAPETPTPPADDPAMDADVDDRHQMDAMSRA